MVHNYISSKTQIAKVYRDLNPQRGDWINDAVEWMAEALDAIGTASQFVGRTYIAKTYSHKAPLPSDLHMIDEVRCPAMSMSNKKEKPKREAFDQLMTYGDEDVHPSLVNSRNTEKGVETYEETFLLVPGYIKTSFPNDWVLIAYKGYALDDDGFPLIPDMYEFKQALYWYVVMKMMEGGKDHPAGLKWTHAREEWLRYCTQARNQATMPDAPAYDKFLKSWVNLIPNYDRDFSGIDTGDENTIYHNETITLDDIKG